MPTDNGHTPADHSIDLYPDLPLTLSTAGTGRPVLVLHGGGGPATVAGLAAHLARTAHTLTPTHPGWNGTHRPDWLTGVDDLALAYLHHLHARGLRDVLVVGSSLGGWTAAEMAVRDTAGVITGLVLIDAVGVHVPAEPIRDFFALDARGVAEYAWHDSDRYYQDPALLPRAQLAAMRANMATLRTLAGDPGMHDPKLLRRLRRVTVPTLLLWGESDRIVTPAYGAAYADAFADGRLQVVPEAGHLPHIEQPEATFALIDAHLRTTGADPRARLSRTGTASA
ncbi:alpha/beta fold hydrolase [Streptomyces sp. NBC_01235]|uniref:alpha/beta fold hydrolase n=1 Tax=Streptomyces sp. NBC_01235 TaxID=2903788 RepID=UPI002E109548|nr:alpha/beta hydrolase [Streptomyces sp. NBC_01235]